MLPEGLLAGSYAVALRDSAGNSGVFDGDVHVAGPRHRSARTRLSATPTPDSAYRRGQNVPYRCRSTMALARSVRAAGPRTRRRGAGTGADDPCVPERSAVQGPCNFSFAAPDVPSNSTPSTCASMPGTAVQNHATAHRRIQVAWSPHVDVVAPQAGTHDRRHAGARRWGTGFVPGLSTDTDRWRRDRRRRQCQRRFHPAHDHAACSQQPTRSARWRTARASADARSRSSRRRSEAARGQPQARADGRRGHGRLCGDQLSPGRTRFYWSQGAGAKPSSPILRSDLLPDPALRDGAELDAGVPGAGDLTARSRSGADLDRRARPGRGASPALEDGFTFDRAP